MKLKKIEKIMVGYRLHTTLIPDDPINERLIDIEIKINEIIDKLNEK